jgi:S-adenosylmethionine:tRNA ribosyltransferase-isomerase
MQTSDFNYYLPVERIAQIPIEPRHASRLLVLDRKAQTMVHTRFWDIHQFLEKGDLLVINKTRVIPARVYAKKSTGGKIQLLFIKKILPLAWEVLVGGKKMTLGQRVILPNDIEGEVIQELDHARRIIQFSQPIENVLAQLGEMPLPPYIHTHLENPERYQTVYAKEPGSAAAPTAGLHFTPELIQKLKQTGIDIAELTLHVGLDTFAPVTEKNPEKHTIHSEWCRLDEIAARKINRTAQEGGRIVAVGTTAVRTLETAGMIAPEGRKVLPTEGDTKLFILPGYRFKVVDAMVTNFHLPKSSLIMLVCAFAGKNLIMKTYREAIKIQYRFYSFGDAMLIL